MKTKRRGLTLIELIVASTIVALVMAGLYTTFSQGMRVYRTAEEGLDRTQEMRVFLMFLRRELSGMVAYAPIPFEGKEQAISFPTRVKRFTRRGYEENIYHVTYVIKSNQIVREEERIQKKAGGGTEKRSFVVIDHIRRGEFSFPFRDKETPGAIWREAWDPKDGDGLPRAVRLRMQLVTPDTGGNIHLGGARRVESVPVFFDEQFYIPQGSWGSFE